MQIFWPRSFKRSVVESSASSVLTSQQLWWEMAMTVSGSKSKCAVITQWESSGVGVLWVRPTALYAVDASKCDCSGQRGKRRVIAPQQLSFYFSPKDNRGPREVWNPTRTAHLLLSGAIINPSHDDRREGEDCFAPRAKRITVGNTIRCAVRLACKSPQQRRYIT